MLYKKYEEEKKTQLKIRPKTLLKVTFLDNHEAMKNPTL